MSSGQPIIGDAARADPLMPPGEAREYTPIIGDAARADSLMPSAGEPEYQGEPYPEWQAWAAAALCVAIVVLVIILTN